MSSFRKRVTSYFRQLSFHNNNETRQRRYNLNENTFVTDYLEGQILFNEGPAVLHGKNATDLPSYDIGFYHLGDEDVVARYTGPNGGLTTVKKVEKHLTVTDPDIDYIDTHDDDESNINNSNDKIGHNHTKSPVVHPVNPATDGAVMILKVAGQTYYVTNERNRQGKSQSLGSLTELNIDLNKSKKYLSTTNADNGNGIIATGADSSKDNGNNRYDHNDDHVKNDEIEDIDKDADKEYSLQETTITIGTVKDTSITTITTTSSTIVTDDVKEERSKNFGLAKSRSEGNPFDDGKRGRRRKNGECGKMIRLTERPTVEADGDMRVSTSNDDRSLPHEWNVKSDHAFGLSDSLYDTDQVTKSKRNGDPIADCFGLIARSDSVVMALADGVNWGEKACVAAKCAIHGCLRYLNETVFDDTRPFRELIVKDENDSCVSAPSSIQSAQSTFHANRHNRVANTRDLFVCLLRSFSCAHQLILENGGTLTTLTVAVVLPLCGRSTNNKRLIERYHQSKRSNEKRNEDEDEMTKSADDHVQKSTTNEKIDEPFDYVCCVCNVGDTFAYVHSPIDGLRELTKGSHDVTVERDMRDALGALGPVDGNTKQPELSNLTLSVTVLRRGDVVMIASDGLTDNFDPNVCRFTVNLPESKTRTTCTRGDGDADGGRKSEKEQRERRQRMQDQQRHHKVDEPHRPPQHHPHGQRHRDGETTKEKSKAPTKPPRKNAKNGGRESVDRIANDDVAASVTRAKRPSATTESADVAQICETDVPSKPQEAPVINNALIAQFLQDNPLKPSSASTMSSSSNDKNKNEPKKCGDEGRASQTSGRKAGNCPEKKKQQQHQSSNYQHHTNHNRNVSKSSRHQQHKDQDQSLNKRADQKTSTRPPPSSSSSTITGAKKNDVKESSTTAATARHAFFRSKTTLGIITRTSTTPTSSSKAIKKKHAKKPIVRNDDGVPYVTPLQRYELTLLMMEDVIRRGLSGTDAKEKSSRGGPSISVTNARRLCETLVGFAFNVTSAKRRTLEDVDHYYDRRDGVLVEVSTQEKRTRRRRAMEKAQHLPGKLDHVSVVAWNVGNTTTTDSRSSSRTSYASS